MDYEKKYNEALERAKQIRYGNPSSGTAIVVCEKIFPELRESEDERIRKVIFKLLLGMREEIFTSQDDIVTKEKALSYIEKQKDFAANEYWRGFKNGRDEVIENPDMFNLQEKQKEQKPVTDDLDQEVHRFFEECITVYDAKIYGVEERVIPVDCYEVTAHHFAKWQKDQDSAEWSEEDEKMIECLIRRTQEEFDELCNDRYGHQEIISDLKESCRKRMNWLENRLKYLSAKIK